MATLSRLLTCCLKFWSGRLSILGRRDVIAELCVLGCIDVCPVLVVPFVATPPSSCANVAFTLVAAVAVLDFRRCPSFKYELRVKELLLLRLDFKRSAKPMSWL